MMAERPPHQPPRREARPAWKAAIACALAFALAAPGLAAAQEVGGPSRPAPGLLVDATIERAVQDALGATPVEPAQASKSKPDKRWGHAVLGTIGVNVVFNLVNLTFRPDSREEFKVTPKTWWDNLKYGMIFDDNNFSTNQFGHPYQGNLYFNVGRANGLNY